MDIARLPPYCSMGLSVSTEPNLVLVHESFRISFLVGSLCLTLSMPMSVCLSVSKANGTYESRNELTSSQASRGRSVPYCWCDHLGCVLHRFNTDRQHLSPRSPETPWSNEKKRRFEQPSSTTSKQHNEGPINKQTQTHANTHRQTWERVAENSFVRCPFFFLSIFPLSRNEAL